MNTNQQAPKMENRAAYDTFKTTDTIGDKQAFEDAKRDSLIAEQVLDLKEDSQCSKLDINMIDVFQRMIDSEKFRAEDKYLLNKSLYLIYKTAPSMKELIEKYMSSTVEHSV